MARKRLGPAHSLYSSAAGLESRNVRCPERFYRRGRRRGIIEERFGVDAKAASDLITMGDQSARRAADLYHFTSVLKRALDDDGCQKIVEMLWDIAFADGVVDEFEENTIWRIAELLGVSTRSRVLLRQRVAGQTPRDAP